MTISSRVRSICSEVATTGVALRSAVVWFVLNVTRASSVGFVCADGALLGVLRAHPRFVTCDTARTSRRGVFHSANHVIRHTGRLAA
jgi:hypothetical protein